MDFDRQPPVWVFAIIGAAAFFLLSCVGCCGFGIVPVIGRRRIRRF
jgi:hypothetical protein